MIRARRQSSVAQPLDTDSDGNVNKSPRIKSKKVEKSEAEMPTPADRNNSMRKSPTKYMSFNGNQIVPGSGGVNRGKTIRESLQSETTKYAIAKETASPLRRTSSQSRSRLYLAATGQKAPNMP